MMNEEALWREIHGVTRAMERLKTTDRPTASGSSHTHVDGETPSGAMNGSNVTFTLAHTPSPGSSLQLFLNGLRLSAGAGNDYTLSGATITMANAPAEGGALIADYIV